MEGKISWVLFDYLFNTLSTAGLISLFSLILLYGRKKESGLHVFIVLWALAVILHLIFFLLNLNEAGPPLPLLQQLGYPLSLLHMPLLYLGIRTSMEPGPVGRWEIFAHLLPYLLFVGVLAGLSASSPEPIMVKSGFLVFADPRPIWFQSHNGNILAISGAVYALLILRQLFRSRQLLQATQSTLRQHQLRWIRFLIFSGVFLFGVIYVLIILGAEWQFFPRGAVFKCVSAYLGTFALLFSYRFQHHLFQVFQSASLRDPTTSLPEEKASASPSKVLPSIAKKIQRQLHDEQLYLQEDLSLYRLAEAIGESPHTTSQTINVEMNTNFYHLVNSVRIAHAQELLRDQNYDHYSILGIAQECGFSSKSTFYKLFREHTGTTPTKFRQQQ